jgi:glycine cleavage system pyridoxal-binding protein P
MVPDGLKAIAVRVHELTRRLERQLAAMGVKQTNPAYFDTLRIELHQKQRRSP